MRFPFFACLILGWICSSQEVYGSKESFVISLVDGHVQTIDAWTGELRGVFFSSGPLIRASVSPESILDNEVNVVVPGFDGSLYWIESLQNKNKNDRNTDDDSDYNNDSDDHYHRGGGDELKAIRLPLNALEITDEPRTLCTDMIHQPSSYTYHHEEDHHDSDGSTQNEDHSSHYQSERGREGKVKTRECGLVVGERSTTIFALDPESGNVKWMKEAHTGSIHSNKNNHDDEEEDSNQAGGKGDLVEDEPMLLQRDEYTVRFSEVSDGTEVWNVSVALFSTVELSRPRSLTRLFKNSPTLQNKLALTSYGHLGEGESFGFDDFGYHDFQTLGVASLPRLQLIKIDDDDDGRDDGVVYRLEALDQESGQLLWSRNLSDREAVSSIYGIWSGLWVNIDPRQTTSTSYIQEEEDNEMNNQEDVDNEQDECFEDNVLYDDMDKILYDELSVPSEEIERNRIRDDEQINEQNAHPSSLNSNLALTSQTRVYPNPYNQNNQNDDEWKRKLTNMFPSETKKTTPTNLHANHANNDRYSSNIETSDQHALVSLDSSKTSKTSSPSMSTSLSNKVYGLSGKVKCSHNLVYVLPDTSSSSSSKRKQSDQKNAKKNDQVEEDEDMIPPPSAMDHLYSSSLSQHGHHHHQQHQSQSGSYRAVYATRSAIGAMAGIKKKAHHQQLITPPSSPSSSSLLTLPLSSSSIEKLQVQSQEAWLATQNINQQNNENNDNKEEDINSNAISSVIYSSRKEDNEVKDNGHRHFSTPSTVSIFPPENKRRQEEEEGGNSDFIDKNGLIDRHSPHPTKAYPTNGIHQQEQEHVPPIRNRNPSPWISFDENYRTYRRKDGNDDEWNNNGGGIYQSGTSTHEFKHQFIKSSNPNSNLSYNNLAQDGLLLSWNLIFVIILIVIGFSSVVALVAFKFGRKKTILESPSPSPRMDGIVGHTNVPGNGNGTMLLDHAALVEGLKLDGLTQVSTDDVDESNQTQRSPNVSSSSSSDQQIVQSLDSMNSQVGIGVMNMKGLDSSPHFPMPPLSPPRSSSTPSPLSIGDRGEGRKLLSRSSSTASSSSTTSSSTTSSPHTIPTSPSLSSTRRSHRSPKQTHRQQHSSSSTTTTSTIIKISSPKIKSPHKHHSPNNHDLSKQSPRPSPMPSPHLKSQPSPLSIQTIEPLSMPLMELDSGSGSSGGGDQSINKIKNMSKNNSDSSSGTSSSSKNLNRNSTSSSHLNGHGSGGGNEMVVRVASESDSKTSLSSSPSPNLLNSLMSTNKNNQSQNQSHNQNININNNLNNMSTNISDMPVDGINQELLGKWSLQQRYRGEFEQKKQLGQGGFGAVYQAKNKLDGFDYAIKKVRLSSKHPAKIDKVLREVRILAQLDSKHIIRYYQAWIEPLTKGEQEEMILEKARKKANCCMPGGMAEEEGIDELGGMTTTGDELTSNTMNTTDTLSASMLSQSRNLRQRQWSVDSSVSYNSKSENKIKKKSRHKQQGGMSSHLGSRKSKRWGSSLRRDQRCSSGGGFSTNSLNMDKNDHSNGGDDTWAMMAEYKGNIEDFNMSDYETYENSMEITIGGTQDDEEQNRKQSLSSDSVHLSSSSSSSSSSGGSGSTVLSQHKEITPKIRMQALKKLKLELGVKFGSLSKDEKAFRLQQTIDDLMDEM
mmetsp:Transcript_973/g.1238  ORF Transcript_973/g.1238 Transcript_973/m.1238 type:complete len:1641 (+) Transcript_973:133-5055(+)